MNTSFERTENTTNEWYTPKWIIDSLGEFELDPCAPEIPVYRTARRMVDKNEDGLLHDWGGERVWLNPPYSHPLVDAFVNKMALNGNGIALLFNRMDCDMWHKMIFPYASAILIMQGRVKFLKPNGDEGQSAGCGSVLVAYGKINAEILKNSGIRGQYFDIIK